jgi:Tol biopolymer transport system component
MRWLALLTLIVLSATGCAESNAEDAEAEATGTIAFVRGDHVWLMHADGSGQRRLTRGADPSWSPDGRRIALSVDRNRSDFSSYSQIWVIDADGDGLRRLTTGEQPYDTHSSPVWSPDGKTIAFEGYNDGNYWINVVGLDGSGQRELSQKGGPYVDVAPVWAPDGRSIAFTHSDAVYVMRPDGSRRRMLARMKGATLTWGGAWSPDGRRIAFLSDGDLWVMNANGRRPQKLVDSPGKESYEIAWSPDGQKLAFSVLERGSSRRSLEADSEVFVVNADGSDLRKLTDNDRVADDDPVWSPDGRAIGFTSDRDGKSEIYVMNADGSNQHNVSQSPLEDFSPAWSPKD